MWTGHRPLWRGSKTGLTSSPVETQSHSAAGRIPLRKLWEYVNKQWLQYKSERKEYYTPTGLKSLINRIIKNIKQYGNEKVIDVIDQSISSGYMCITWDKLNKSTEKSLNKQDNGSIMELKLLGHRQDYSPEEIRQKEYFIEEWEREMLDE